MKIINAMALLCSLILISGSSAFASSHQKAHSKKHHASKVAKHKSSKHKRHSPQQVGREAIDQPNTVTRTVASNQSSPRLGALYVSKYFQKSVYADQSGK
jgi:hypothetical protein